MADLIKLSVDVDGPMRGIKIVRDQALPFTIVRALTLTAQEAQAIVQQVERTAFALRNDWTVRNTKITPATKDKMMAEVYTDTGNRASGAIDYLPRQQDGGERVPLSGHKYLAIPTNYLFKYTPKSRPIPDNLRPKAILPPDAQIGQTYAGSFSSGSRGEVKRMIGKATMKKLGVSDFAAFTQVTHSGTLCIFVRHGGMGFRGGSNDAEPWYVLVRNARIKPVFPMTDVVTQVVGSNFDHNFTRAAAEVGINDALRGTGLTVKF
jgi:hypothetical protein